MFTGAIFAIGLATIFTYMAPLIIRTTIDSIIGDKAMAAPGIISDFILWAGGRGVVRNNLWIAAILLVALSVIRGVFNYLTGRWSAEASELIARNLRDKLFERLHSVPVRFYSSWKTGDLIQRCTSDVETIRKFLGVQVVQVGKSLLMLLLIIPILVMLDVKMAILSMVTIPLILTFAIIFFLKIKSTFQKADEAEGIMTAVLQENLTGIRVVRAFARQDYEIDKFEDRNSDYRDNIYKLIKILGLYWGLSDLLIYTQTGLVLVAGTYWTIYGDVTLGTLVAFVSYVEFLLWPIRATGRTLTDLGKAFVALDRVQIVLGEPSESTDGWEGDGTPLKGDIVIQDVTFSYDDNETVLKNISLTINAGETVVLIGPTGSGKSTLVNLLPRLWDYASGSITIDGRELSSINRKYIRSQIGIVLQEPFLFSKSLRDNIRLGRFDNLKDSEIYEATRTASVHEEILSFDKGYNTMVGERGVTLSGGQKQRVAIARAILQNPSILIFDDSLSALDTETEARIREALISRHGAFTTIVIAHRLNTAIHADQVYVIENGQITQQGVHTDLIHQPGLYQRLWNLQSSGSADDATRR